MKLIRSIMNYFTRTEIFLWSFSVVLIVISFCIFDRNNYLTLTASLIGVTSLIFCAKGNPVGQILMVLFSIIYGVISFGFKYYGEMLTYIGMTLPMSVFALISWLKNPYNGKRSQVSINNGLKAGEKILAAVLTAAVTVIFYYVLGYFNTANIIPSTFSVSTSFLAVWLTYKRSPCFALAYACNDVVLVILWILASVTDIRYLSVVVCFCAFLINDIYGFINWKRMQKSQQG